MFRSMKLATIALLSLLGHVNDPYGILEKADKFIGNVPYEAALTCSDVAAREHKECYVKCNIDGVCEELCGPGEAMTAAVTACGENERTIVLKRERFVPVTKILTRAEYEAAHGNYLRYLLAEMTAYDEDYVDLDYSSEHFYELADGTKVPSFRVVLRWHRYDDVGGEYYDFPMAITLGQGLPWIAQELEHDLTPQNYGTPTERLLGWSRRR